MYRRIDRLRRSFTPLVKLLSKKLFLVPVIKKNHAATKNNKTFARKTKLLTSEHDENKNGGGEGGIDNDQNEVNEMNSEKSSSVVLNDNLRRRNQASQNSQMLSQDDNSQSVDLGNIME